jgi:N-acetylmuramoyl-L-alanine amidase-like protein/putative peptidoglycan binding protein
MATPLSAEKFIKALRAEGVSVRQVRSWRNHNRNGKGAWGPMNGVMIHHTAGLGVGMIDYCYNGSDELPGPLCHGVIDKEGVVHLVGCGRANHAGGGDPDVLAVVRDESYGDSPPAPNEHQGSPGAVDGNSHFYGFECVNKGDGKDPWTDAQLDAIERVSAALCRAHGWTAKSVIGHKEWSDWKSDPTFSMVTMRARIAARLGDAPKPDPKPDPTSPEVSLKHITAAARLDPDRDQGGTTYGAEVELVENALEQLGYLDRQWVDGSFGTKTIDAYAALQRHLGYVGPDADGIPGKHSATWLGLRTGLFRAVD